MQNTTADMEGGHMTIDHRAQLRVHIRWMIRRDMAEVLEIADRAYILQTGRVQMQGPAADIRTNPDVRKAYLGL